MDEILILGRDSNMGKILILLKDRDMNKILFLQKDRDMNEILFLWRDQEGEEQEDIDKNTVCIVGGHLACRVKPWMTTLEKSMWSTPLQDPHPHCQTPVEAMWM
jgi:hypothetical protein